MAAAIFRSNAPPRVRNSTRTSTSLQSCRYLCLITFIVMTEREHLIVMDHFFRTSMSLHRSPPYRMQYLRLLPLMQSTDSSGSQQTHWSSPLRGKKKKKRRTEGRQCLHQQGRVASPGGVPNRRIFAVGSGNGGGED